MTASRHSFTNAAPLTEAEVEIFGTRGYANFVVISNPSAASAAWVKFYEADAATVVVGTTEPSFEFIVGTEQCLPIYLSDRSLGSGLTMSCSVNPGADATAPASDLIGWVDFIEGN